MTLRNKNMACDPLRSTWRHKLGRYSKSKERKVGRRNKRKKTEIKEGYLFMTYLNMLSGARVSVRGRDTMLEVGRSRVWFPMRSLDFFS
jgi:hypothetical protein